MSANPRPLVATIYNPHTQSKDALIAGFTARKAKFDRLFRDIAEAPMTKAEQHYLIQGVRGMGKTTFLLRLAYEIENTPDLAQRLIPIVFNEEEYGISSLADFWERTARYLEEADPTFAGLEDRMAAQYGGEDYERAALGTLLEALRKHNKKLILLIDNIGDLFRKFPELENKRLREVLLTVPDLRLIGATPTLIEQTHDYSKPYFDFFKIIQLGGLNQQETNDLFLKLGEAYGTDTARELVEKRPGRIEALRRLTGGVIRTMVLLFEIMVENNTGSVFRDLNALIDLVTPLYKHRIDELPTQQQKIVAALANAWDAANTKELAQVVRLESKVVSAQLKQLINNGIVEKVETNTKNHLYRLEERFFNIWYLMRFGRKTDQRVLWLIRFFEEMFAGDDEWIQERVEALILSMKEGFADPEATLYLTTAFSKVIKDEVQEDSLNRTTRDYLSNTKSLLTDNLQSSKLSIVDSLMREERFGEVASYIEKNKMTGEQCTLDLIASKLLSDKSDDLTKIVFNSYSSKGANKIIKLVNNLKNILEPQSNDELNQSELKYVKDIFEKVGFLTLSLLMFSLFVTDSRNFRKNNNDFEIYNTDNLVHMIVVQYILRRDSQRKNIVSLLIKKYFSEMKKQGAEFFLNSQLVSLWMGDYYKILELPQNDAYNELSKVLSYQYSDKYKINRTSIRHGYYYGLQELFNLFFKLLLAKKQYHTAYKYFQQEEWQLKDRFKPLYYATMYFLQDEYPTEYLRMGPELAETVQDILKEVEQMAVDYA